MDVLHAIHTRRSIRKFLDVPVEWDKIATVADAGRVAPSSGNIQAWRFVIVRDAEKRHAIAEACMQQYWMEHAPAFICIFAELPKQKKYYGVRGERLYSVQDCAMAGMQMQLAAHALGLGSCFVSAFDEEAISTIFSLPDSTRPQGILVLGYPNEKPQKPLRYRIENVCWLEVYSGGGGRVGDADAVMWNFRVLQKPVEYAKQASADVGKLTRTQRSQLLEKLKEQGRKMSERIGKKARKEKHP